MYITFVIEPQEFDPHEWDMDTEVTFLHGPDMMVHVTEEITFIESDPDDLGTILVRYKHQEGVNEHPASSRNFSQPWYLSEQRPEGSEPIWTKD